MLAVVVLTQVAAADWLRIDRPPRLELPRDHGAHPDHRTEWWYVTGIVETTTGDRHGFQVTFFRHGLDPSEARAGQSRLRARQVMAAHLAVADITSSRFASAQRLRRVAAGLAGYSTRGLDVWVEDWEMAMEQDGSLRIAADDLSSGVGARLRLQPRREMVLHGDAGYSRKGPEPGNASAYVSLTRLDVTGELTSGGVSRQVTGTAWFDHEWGTSQLGEGVVGWDWFSLHLDDGRDLMVYRLRREDGSPSPWSSGTLVGADGSTTTLGVDDVGLEVTRWWRSPSGSRYPAGWQLRIPGHGIDLTVRPLISNAVVDGGHSTGVTYWEGPVAASGSTSAEGYAELTGYDGSLADRF
jgi:predicted secreted hydrolase